ncbi:hypothetical protein GJ496_004780 [Pomphorhynchus laevis]|nr:hypothetical protein GJ496_004780 [Pomphorhynchus laevis]
MSELSKDFDCCNSTAKFTAISNDSQSKVSNLSGKDSELIKVSNVCVSKNGVEQYLPPVAKLAHLCVTKPSKPIQKHALFGTFLREFALMVKNKVYFNSVKALENTLRVSFANGTILDDYRKYFSINLSSLGSISILSLKCTPSSTMNLPQCKARKKFGIITELYQKIGGESPLRNDNGSKSSPMFSRYILQQIPLRKGATVHKCLNRRIAIWKGGQVYKSFEEPQIPQFDGKWKVQGSSTVLADDGGKGTVRSDVVINRVTVGELLRDLHPEQ